LGPSGAASAGSHIKRAELTSANETGELNDEEGFMSLTDDDVITIMKYLEESRFEEMQLSIGDFKLILKKSNNQISRKQSEILTDPSTIIGENTSIDRAPSAGPSEGISAIQKVGARVKDEVERTGTRQIKAPIMGTFYRASKPGAKPFVEVGQQIKAEDTVCIIEVMKLFNTVKAGVNGRIAEIMAEDAELVEFNQPLFLVDVTRE
jgi:acetyl-CoA carboxylase biotin carboxyl carrier protein